MDATSAQNSGQTEQKPEDIVPIYDKMHAAIPVDFNFKSVEVTDPATGDVEKDEKGQPKKKRRPTLKLVLKLLTLEGIAKVLTEGTDKQQELLLEAVRKVQLDQARDIISEDESVKQDNFPMEKLDWDFISNMPKAERRGGGISKDTWEAFAADYLAVMPAVTQKPVDTIKKHTVIYLSRFQLVRDRKEVLEFLNAQLALYIANSPNAEQFTDCVDFLVNKAEQFMKFDPADYVKNL
jgi:hypothetical protein